MYAKKFLLQFEVISSYALGWSTEGRQSALRFEENTQVTQQPQNCLAVLLVQWHVGVRCLQPEASSETYSPSSAFSCHLPPLTAILGPVSLFCHRMHFCIDQEEIHPFYNSICNNFTIRHAVSSWRVSGQGISCYSNLSYSPGRVTCGDCVAGQHQKKHICLLVYFQVGNNCHFQEDINTWEAEARRPA